MIRVEAWPALMTRETAAAYLNGTVQEIDKLRARGEITAVDHDPNEPSKRVRFRKVDLDRVIENMAERRAS